MKLISATNYLEDNKITTKKLSPQTKQAVLKYLRSFNSVAIAAGYPEDIVTGEMVMIPYYAYRDGEFCWNSSDIYHLEKYDIELNQEFVDKVLSSTK